ncbi:MAG: DUF6525 family protein [Janthinobacterium lividum]
MTSLLSMAHLFGGGARPVKTGNATSTIPLSTELGDKYRAYDALPPEIRHAIALANVDLCPHKIRKLFHRMLEQAKPFGLGDQAVGLYLEQFDMAQLGEVVEFSRSHRQQHGCDTPHVAADATMIGLTSAQYIPSVNRLLRSERALTAVSAGVSRTTDKQQIGQQTNDG